MLQLCAISNANFGKMGRETARWKKVVRSKQVENCIWLGSENVAPEKLALHNFVRLLTFFLCSLPATTIEECKNITVLPSMPLYTYIFTCAHTVGQCKGKCLCNAQMYATLAHSCAFVCVCMSVCVCFFFWVHGNWKCCCRLKVM